MDKFNDFQSDVYVHLYRIEHNIKELNDKYDKLFVNPKE